ncbi:class I SAM-dependent methyltransferase [Endozoicomonadaceae bacterium StTr2]
MLSTSSVSTISVAVNSAAMQDKSSALAQRLGIPLVEGDPAVLDQFDTVLMYDEQGLGAWPTGPGAPGATRCDFVGGAVGHRRKFGGGKGQAIAKAVGLGKGVVPGVLDCTAGLGRDAFVLATLGCEMTLVERSPVVAELLADGLAQAQGDPEVGDIVRRMQLEQGASLQFLEQCLKEGRQFDVVYLDPMFPTREKSALVKKEMRLFHSLVGQDLDADELLAPALKVARYRVVVKRPRKAPDLAGKAPGYRLEGKANRFDIYPLKSFTAK